MTAITRSITLYFTCLVLLLQLPDTALAQNTGPESPVSDTRLTTTVDLLRGFNDDELTTLRKKIPQRPEPKLGAAKPRLAIVSGIVFDDRNGNGAQDDGEAGLVDVNVTDGERVVRTGDDGGFQFQIRFDENPHHRFVVVTRPTGFRATGLFFQRIPFDESRVEYSVNFGLVSDPASAKREFWFMTASDSQFTNIEQMIPTAKDYAQVTSAPALPRLGKPAFLATAGDLTMAGSQYEWDMYDFIRGQSKIPVYEGFGGHDGNCLDPRCTVSFEQRIGPPYYSWDYGGVHFIQLVSETSYLRQPARERQSDWLQADLKSLPPKTPVIAVSHYPLSADWFDLRREEGINVICQIGAHWHVVQAGSRGGVPVLNSAPARGRDWGAYSRTYRWVIVTPHGVRSRLRVAGQYKRLQVVSPGATARTGKQPLVVLAYDTALEVKSVTGRMTSPRGTQSTAKFKQQGDWSWHSEFNPREPGEWIVDLTATDIAGSTWKRRQTVKVERQGRALELPTSDFPTVLSGSPPRVHKSGPSAAIFPLWVTHTGSAHVLHNSPVVADGRVYVSVGNPNAGTPEAGVLCLSATTGEVLWKANSPHGDIRGPVSVHKGHVYAITGDSNVAAWHADNGRLLWSKPMQSSYAAGRPLAINNTPPIPTRFGLLVTDWQKPQYLLDYSSGERLSTLQGDTGYYASFATVFDDVMYSVRRGGGSAIHLPDGKQLYSFDESSRSTSAPIVVAGKLIYNGSSGIRVRDAATGDLVWQKGIANAGYQNAIPVVWGDRILVNGTDLVILDLQTGKTLHTIPCGREPDRFHRSRRQAMSGSSTPVVAGDIAWFGHDDTSLRGITRDGKIVWEHRLGTPIKTAPAVTGNLLLVHDFAGNLWCFEGTGK
jgi:outer membrane protein assembly factor BamB